MNNSLKNAISEMQIALANTYIDKDKSVFEVFQQANIPVSVAIDSVLSAHGSGVVTLLATLAGSEEQLITVFDELVAQWREQAVQQWRGHLHEQNNSAH